jgi:hypothetical protein
MGHKVGTEREIIGQKFSLGYLIDIRAWRFECCGQEFMLDRFTNTCGVCKADYNSGGQRLASREQWGCETGESIHDILSVDYDGGDW